MRHTFPSELEHQSRPSIIFAQKGTKGGSARFPIPAGMTFGESASYGEQDLMAHGAAIANQTRTSGTADIGVAATTDGGEIAGILGTVAPKAIGIGMGVTVNKHTTTEFTGVGTRKHQYSFKLVASNAQESAVIASIVRMFTAALYPTEDSNLTLTLKYPEQWNISFRDVKDGYLPPIFDCYLESFTSTFNAGAHAWFVDNSPVEVDISLGFTETKARTRKDFVK